MDDPGSRPLFTRRLTGRQLVALDGAAAVAYTALFLSFALAGAGRLTTSPPDAPVWARCLVVAGMGLPLAVRRLWPRTVLAVVLAATALSLLLGLAGDSFIAAALALYVVALTRPRPAREPTLAIGVASAAVVLGMGVVGGRGLTWATVPFGLAVMGGAWTIGRAVRERRAHASRSAAQLAEQAVAEERLRIARELHDVVAHSMSLIAVEAGVANHVIAARPEAAHEALRVIETTSRGSLTELRRVLGVLRSGPDAGLAPAPGVTDLRELADRAAMAGVHVSMDVRGVDDLPEGIGLSVYRIVQEAVTNVVRHAAPARCRVVVAVADGVLDIDVTDDGPGRRVLPEDDRQGPGQGLIGMRERVAMYGGRFSAGPRPGGGFAVSVSLPCVAEGAR